MNIKQKISYLQGLTEGLEAGDSKQGRVMAGIMEVLEDMADYIDELQDTQLDLEQYVEAIDEDLNDLEEDAYEDIVGSEDEDADYDEEGYEEFIEVECPKCHENIYFESDVLDDEDVIEVTCPTCDEVVFVNDGSEVVDYVDAKYLDRIRDTEDI